MDACRTLSEARGFFTRAEALDDGFTDAALIAGVRRRELIRIRHGAYAFADLWKPLTPTERHLVRCRAVLHRMGPNAVLSHTSAALAHGVALWGLPMDRVHITRLDDGAGRVEADVAHHRGKVLTEHDVAEVDGMRVVVANRAVMEAASLSSPEQALVAFDSFLHRQLGSHDDLAARFEAMSKWPNVRHLHIPMRMADGGAESPGESRGRWLFRAQHVPAPVLQYPVCDHTGTVLGISDWAWPDQRVLGEFDGRVKYGRFLKPGQSPQDAVFSEKRREDLMREASGCTMFRMVWDDLDHPRFTAERLTRLLKIAS